jgi:[protein-PII] uridylyltransferase
LNLFGNPQRIVRPAFGELSFFAEDRFEKALLNCAPSKRVELFRATLDAGDEHLFNRFREGEDVMRLTRDRAKFMDRLIFYAWSEFKWDKNIALLAVGGYGRSEMHPQSDIDLLFLTRKDNHTSYRESIQGFTTLLWDLQLKIGHSVRTPKQCAQLAKADVTVLTNLIEARTILGDDELRSEMGRLVAPEKIWPADKFYKAKAEEQRCRYERHGIVEYDMEPNTKESPGGLRDIQTIHWIAKRIYGVSSIEQLAGRGIYTEEEYVSLSAARRFLSRVRFGLHMHTGTPVDQLQFENQRALSELFGYRDTPQRLAVEVFMQDYYRSVTVIREINDVLMQVMSDHLSSEESKKISVVNDRFQIRDNYLEARRASVFKDHPSALLEIFVILSRDKKIQGVKASTIRLLREYGSLIDDEFRDREENKTLFLKLIRSPNHLSIPLQMMARYGILGRYLPEFGAITGLPQHDLFHIYPVDVHTLNVVRNIRHFGLPDSSLHSPISTYIFSTLRKPELLVIAGLYHDIAKGRGGDHSELGAHDVKDFAERHGYNAREVKTMMWLVENHLLMSRISQREDTSDPIVINRFARHVGDETNLNLLYALTVADINATNPTLWSNWRASLMRQLYMETRKALRLGPENSSDKQELIQETREAALPILAKKGISQEIAENIWAGSSDEYFLKESPEDIAWHTGLASRHKNPADPIVIVKPYIFNRRERATMILVRLKQSENIFAAVAVAIDQAGLNIQDARIYDNGDVTLSFFYILNEDSEPLGKDSQRADRLERSVREELKTIDDYHQVLGARTKRALKQFPVPTQATLSKVQKHTMLEVVTADRPGLLAVIGQIFVELNIRLHSARINTLGERVEDIFIISLADGTPIADTKLGGQLIDSICETIDQRVEAIAS